MPEGDTIHHAANRIRPVLEGRAPDRILTPSPRTAGQRFAARLAGRVVSSVDAYGKHLFLRFGGLPDSPFPGAPQDGTEAGSGRGPLTIHSHLRMSGSWAVYHGALDAYPGTTARAAYPTRNAGAGRAAWLVLHVGPDVVVQFGGPVLELMTDSRTRFDQRLAGLGPDVLGPVFDLRRFLVRLREDDPTRPIGDALLDQRTVAGIGNVWKAESCFAATIDPWRAIGRTTDAEACAILTSAREQMFRSARDGHRARPRAVYGRRGEACGRCGTTIQSAGQGIENRITYWCPGCQA